MNTISQATVQEVSEQPQDRISRAGLVLRAFLALLALYFAGAILTKIITFGVAVPFWDEWGHVVAWKDFDEGKLSVLSLLLSPAGEHRVVVQILGSIIPWQLSGFNVRAIMVLNWTLAACFPLLGFLITRRMGAASAITPWIVLATSSFFLFNPAAYQLWMWAILPAYLFVPLLFMAAAYLTLTRLPLDLKIIAVAQASFIASFTFGAGLLLWGLLLIPLRQAASWKDIFRRRVSVAIYAFLFLTTVVAYVHLMFTAVRPAPPATGQPFFIPVISFFLAYTGNLVSLFPAVGLVTWAQVIGLVILIVLVLSGTLAIRKCYRQPEWSAVVVWLCVCGYCFAAAVLVAVARRTFGVAYAFEASRYVLSASFLPAATIALGSLALARLRAQPRLHSVLLSSMVALITACLIIRVAQTPNATNSFRHGRFGQLGGKVAIAAADMVKLPQYRQIFPWEDWEQFRTLARFLTQRAGLTPGMWDARFLQTLASAPASANGCGFTDAADITGDRVRVHGWAYLPQRRERAHAVLVASVTPSGEARIAAVTFPSIPRADVFAALKTDEAMGTGWSVDIPASEVVGRSIRGFAYDAETGLACRLSGEPLPK